MQAAVLHGAKDLRMEKRDIPPPASGEVVVAVESVGLCGSDLHYYLEGRNGSNVVRSPVILGHEIGGTVAEVGSGVSDSMLGARVVVEPAVACRTCPTCAAGRYNLCEHSACLGSPPTDGGLAEYVSVPMPQVHRVPETLPAQAVAVLEPLAVAVHALRRAAFVPGESVLITGAGPVGLLVAQVAQAWGARDITVSDVHDARLQAARALGIERTLRPEELGGLRVDRGLECSGAPSALAGALTATKPGGRVVLVGTMPEGDIAARLGVVQRYEVDLVGTFRYAASFPAAVDLVERGAVDVASLVTAAYPLHRAEEAFAHAASGAGLKTVVQCRQAGAA